MDEQTTDRQPLVVGVRFRTTGLVYQFDAGRMVLQRDDRVLVETDRGPAVGVVAFPPRPRTGIRPTHRVVRKADHRDLMREDQVLQRQRQVEREAAAAVHGSDRRMKLVSVDVAADGSKVTVLYAAEDKIDTRELAQELGEVLRMRVEPRLVGARDQARAAGGVGVCGRELCCSSWLREFQPVTVKMAKEQGLALNPSKLAGQCGRLKCCLRYEYQTYQELRRGLPKIGARVQSVKGDGQIARHNALRGTAVLRRAEDGVEVEVSLDDLVAPRGDG